MFVALPPAAKASADALLAARIRGPRPRPAGPAAGNRRRPDRGPPPLCTSAGFTECGPFGDYPAGEISIFMEKSLT
jgi:hypothetical protein